MIGDSRSGLLASLRRLLISGSELAEVRLQLLATELQQEKLRLLESLAWLVVAAMACCVGLLLFSLFVVLLVEPAHRLLALGVLSLAFLVGAGLVLLGLMVGFRVACGVLQHTGNKKPPGLPAVVWGALRSFTRLPLQPPSGARTRRTQRNRTRNAWTGM